MVIKKCAKCKKNITKKVPGLECSRCNKIVHADPVCSKLSNKQLNTLRNSVGIEWSCEDCLMNISCKSSFVTPDEADDEDDYEAAEIPEMAKVLDTKKLVQDISREVKKTFREEIRGLQSSLEFLSEQLTEMDQIIKKQDSKIKDLENKNYDLLNKNKNLELRVDALELGLNEFEQKFLSSSLEIAGLPEIPHSDIKKVVHSVAVQLKIEDKEIQSSLRLPGTKEKPGSIVVELKSKVLQQQWLEAGKKHRLTVSQLMSNAPKGKDEDPIYIREALTKYQKSLLYKAKTQLLNKSCKYVWCKNGRVYARMSNDSKIYYIRTLNDIKQVEKNCCSQFVRQPEVSTPL
ncbi:unnamed protein product [Euphydryas editha]|uniref:Zinc finger DNA binding protein n=1 Tax=Euphydryas editha TaxID=104508 RepID=A0AAU9UP45_EUPED|nr:unnamed protein product [Euphydryas editha]